MTASNPRPSGFVDSRSRLAFLGHADSFSELLSVFSDRPGLTVLACDPLSGASALLTAAVNVKPSAPGAPVVVVDASRAFSSPDLAAMIAAQSVAVLRPGSAAWWRGEEPEASTAGLQLHKELHGLGMDPERFRSFAQKDSSLLLAALDLAASLAGGPLTVVIDHLGPCVSGMRGGDGREALSLLRTAYQRHRDLDLVVVDYQGGPVVRALADPEHPMYRAGSTLHIARMTPRGFMAALSQFGAPTSTPGPVFPAELLGAAAELAAGVPAYIWQIAELSNATPETPAEHLVAAANTGWQGLRYLTEPALATQWNLLQRVHPAARALIAAISSGRPPYSIPAAKKTSADGLNRLRDLGVAWQPEPRRWAVSDPLLAAFAREHAPPWLHEGR